MLEKFPFLLQHISKIIYLLFVAGFFVILCCCFVNDLWLIIFTKHFIIMDIFGMNICSRYSHNLQYRTTDFPLHSKERFAHIIS